MPIASDRLLRTVSRNIDCRVPCNKIPFYPTQSPFCCCYTWSKERDADENWLKRACQWFVPMSSDEKTGVYNTQHRLYLWLWHGMHQKQKKSDQNKHNTTHPAVILRINCLASCWCLAVTVRLCVGVDVATNGSASELRATWVRMGGMLLLLECARIRWCCGWVWTS